MEADDDDMNEHHHDDNDGEVVHHEDDDLVDQSQQQQQQGVAVTAAVAAAAAAPPDDHGSIADPTNSLLIAASVEAAAAKYHQEQQDAAAAAAASQTIDDAHTAAAAAAAVNHGNLILAYHHHGQAEHAHAAAEVVVDDLIPLRLEEAEEEHSLHVLHHEQQQELPVEHQELTTVEGRDHGDIKKRKADFATTTDANDDDANHNNNNDDTTITTTPAPAPKRRAPPTRVNWDDRLAMLQAYKQEHGDLLIPIRYKKNPSLGKFVHNTREQFKLYHKRTPEGYKKKCSLTADKISQLDALGFVWSTERSRKQQEDWDARLGQLLDYKEIHGDCLVPHGYSGDASFAEWIHRQRTTYATHLKEGRKNGMIEERMKKLEEIGFNFRVHLDKWEDHYQELAAYCEEHGNCMVPTHFAQNPKLGRWVHTQRHQRRLLEKNKKSSMTAKRIHDLDQLGFAWEVRQSVAAGPRHTWIQRATQIREFYKEHGHFLVPPEKMPDLWNWCAEQKLRLQNLHRHGTDATHNMKTKMNRDRVVILRDIGFTKDVELAPSLDGAPPVLPDEEDDDSDDDDEVVPNDESAHFGRNMEDLAISNDQQLDSSLKPVLFAEHTQQQQQGHRGNEGYGGECEEVHV